MFSWFLVLNLRWGDKLFIWLQLATPFLHNFSLSCLWCSGKRQKTALFNFGQIAVCWLTDVYWEGEQMQIFVRLVSHFCVCRLTAALSYSNFTDKANTHLSSAPLQPLDVCSDCICPWSEMACLLSFGKLWLQVDMFATGEGWSEGPMQWGQQQES